MQFPNAASGSKKIFTGEILMLIVAILSGITLIVGVVGAAKALELAAAGGDVSGMAIGGIAALGAIGIAVLIISLIALILTIVGVASCSKDEPMFKSVLFIFVASLVVAVISGFVSNTTAKGVLGIVNDLFSLISTIMMIGGFNSLADKLGNDSVRNTGNSILKILIVLILGQLIIRIIMNFFGATAVGTTVAAVLGVILLALAVIQYFMYLAYLAKAKNMLNA